MFDTDFFICKMFYRSRIFPTKNKKTLDKCSIICYIINIETKKPVKQKKDRQLI